MTRSLVLIASLAFLLSGCTGDPDESGATTSPDAADDTSSSGSGTPSAPGNAGRNGTAGSSFSPVHKEHDFGGAPATETFDISPTAGSVTLHVYFRSDLASGPQTVCPVVQNEVSINVNAPDGSVLVRVHLTPGDTSVNSQNRCGPQNFKTGTMEPGTYTISFEGSTSSLVGVVDVSESS